MLYLAPLKALLNNLLPRLEEYAGWLGRRAALWHGDVDGVASKRILRQPPDILLTTPESLEAMLISAKVDPARIFASVRAVVVDEAHAFGSDDRGWHLLAVLERISSWPADHSSASGCRPPSATQRTADLASGLGPGRQGTAVVAPELPLTPARPANSEHNRRRRRCRTRLRRLGRNAAQVIASLHQGEKRLVFCDSRQLRSKNSVRPCASTAYRRSCPTPRCRPTNGAGPSRRSPRRATA